jgi:hypothetical protein
MGYWLIARHWPQIIWRDIKGRSRIVFVLGEGVLSTAIIPDPQEVAGQFPVPPTRKISITRRCLQKSNR